jgi:hypothetical protein
MSKAAFERALFMVALLGGSENLLSGCASIAVTPLERQSQRHDDSADVEAHHACGIKSSFPTCVPQKSL